MFADEVLKIITHTGRRVVESSHRYFISVSFDNNEHIPSVKASIDAIGLSADELISKDAGAALRQQLKSYARELFVEYWLKLAESSDDSAGIEIEKKLAMEEFDNIFDRKLEMSS